MKLHFCLLAMLWPAFNVFSQLTEKVKPLSIGDIVPDVTLSLIGKDQSVSTCFSDHKGKLILLDFWATWCGPCVAGLPKLNELQKKFADKLVIFPVSVVEKSEVVREFIGRRPELKLSFAGKNSLLEDYFPAKAIPHTILIGPDGKILAITSTVFIDDKVIENAWVGKPLNVPLKKDMLSFNSGKPLLINGNGGTDDKIIYRSMLTRFMPGISSGSSRREGKGFNFFTYKNITIPLLYLHAFKQPLYYRESRLYLKGVTDSNRYVFVSNAGEAEREKWSIKNSYCYDFISPSNISREAESRIMVEELNKSFYALYGLKGSMKPKLITCYVLVQVRPDLMEKLRSTHVGSPSTSFSRNGKTVLQNYSFEELGRILESRIYIPVVNETNSPLHIDWEVSPAIKRDLPLLRSMLQEYGLDLIEAKRELPVLVLEELSNKS